MANNKIQVKRTSVSGRTANVTSSGNSQYIDAGELALNMADGILYSSNGSALITVGSNLVNQNISGNLTVNAVIANGSLGTSGQVLTTNSTGVYWSNVSSGGGSGTVTSVDSGSGLTGGPITNSGTLSVLANNGIIANSSGTFVNANTGLVVNTAGVFVNSDYIATLTANNTSFVGTVSAANVVSNAQLSSNLSNYQTTAGLSSNVATLTANNTSFVGTVSAANVVSNAQLSANLSNYQTTAGLSSNVATLTANNTSFVGTVSAANVVSNAQLSANLSNYQTTAGLSANVATLTANNTSFVGTVSAANVVSNAQLSANLSNYQTTAGLSANVATLTSNNAINLDGQPASFYLGSMVTTETRTAPGTYSKPVGLLGVKVIVSGGGGGSCTLTTGPNDNEVTSFNAGGYGGVGIKYIPAASLPGSISVTVGAAGAAGGALPALDNPVGPAGGTGGTSSFGTFVTSTGGAGGTPAGAGAIGVSANANYYATGGPAGILNAFNTSSALSNDWGYGAPSATRAAGKQGVVIIEEYF